MLTGLWPGPISTVSVSVVVVAVVVVVVVAVVVSVLGHLFVGLAKPVYSFFVHYLFFFLCCTLSLPLHLGIITL